MFSTSLHSGYTTLLAVRLYLHALCLTFTRFCYCNDVLVLMVPQLASAYTAVSTNAQCSFRSGTPYSSAIDDIANCGFDMRDTGTPRIFSVAELATTVTSKMYSRHYVLAMDYPLLTEPRACS